MIAILTCYFNIDQSFYRLNNYRQFSKNLIGTGVPIYTCEVAFKNQPFELNSGDADFLLQIRSKDIIWQKERGLNLLLESLPPEITKVIWMDCDILYLDDNWLEKTSRQLDDFDIIQPYSYAISMPNYEKMINTNHGDVIFDGCSEQLRIRKGYAATFKENDQQWHKPSLKGHCGYIWASQRKVLDKHKLYDYIITGAGDLFMVSAMVHGFHWFDNMVPLKRIPEKALEHFFDWATPFYDDIMGNISCTNDTIVHLWHGSINNRVYLNESKKLGEFDYNPNEDIRIGDNGLLEWSSDKPKLHEFSKKMFNTKD